MKIKALKTSAYGKFDDLRRWDDLSDSINVFYGHNEAGKSTIFKMIVDMLFGFKVTKKDKNVQVNRKINQLNVTADIVGFGESSIQRVLEDKSHLTILKEGQKREYDNEPIEEAKHITRATYEEIYALDLNRLAVFKDNTWEDIEEMLLKQYSGDTFNSAKQVLHLMEEEMKQIKRQSGRGNSKLKELEQLRRDTFKKKKKIQGQLEEAETLKRKIKRIGDEIQVLREDKIQLYHRKDKAEHYLPVMKLLEEQNKLEENVRALQAFEGLNSTSYHLNKNAMKQLYVQLDEVSEKVSKYIMEKRRLSELIASEDLQEIELQDTYQKYLALDGLSLEVSELQQSLQMSESQFIKAFENTFDEAFQTRHFEELLNINYLNLKSLVQELENIYEEIKIMKRNKRLMGSGRSSSSIGFFVLLIIAGAVGIYLDLEALYNMVATGVMGFSLMAIIHQMMKKRLRTLDEEALLAEKDDLRDRLVGELNGIRLSSIAAEFAGQELLSQILSLKTLAETYTKNQNAFEVKQSHLMQLEQTVDQYLKRHIGSLDKENQPFDLLMRRLDEIKKHHARIEFINGQLDSLNEQLQNHEQQLNEKEQWLNKADDFLKTLGEGSIDVGLERLNDNVHDLHRLEEINHRLKEADYEETILQDFIRDYKSSTKEKFDLATILTEIELISKTMSDKMVEHANVTKDYERILESNNLDQVKSRLESIDQEIETAKMQYDRLMLMHHIVSEAEESYRQANQPEVFANAGKYLNMMTDGRYRSLEIVEVIDKKRRFEIHVNCEGQNLQVDETFSMGTLNQIYLALRLSLIDHLDKDHTQLPVCFDELLVNWDEKRLTRTLQIISQIAKTRQVMIFTCHDWFLSRVEQLAGVKVFEL